MLRDSNLLVLKATIPKTLNHSIRKRFHVFWLVWSAQAAKTQLVNLRERTKADSKSTEQSATLRGPNGHEQNSKAVIPS